MSPPPPGSREPEAPPQAEAGLRVQRLPAGEAVTEERLLVRAGAAASSGSVQSMSVTSSPADVSPAVGTQPGSEGGRRRLLAAADPAVAGTGAPAAAPGPAPLGTRVWDRTSSVFFASWVLV
jgi:hypothetical protein